MSGATGTTGSAGDAGSAGDGAAFAELLRALKDRSGLSYGVLAKRLHMSTSTLHRYCNGSAVPADYAPVERLARACRATPAELVELHRRWILADAARGRKGSGAGPGTGQVLGRGAGGESAAGGESPADAGTSAGAGPAADAEPAAAAGTPPTVDGPQEPGPGRQEPGPGHDEPLVATVPATPARPARPRRRRAVLLASGAAAAVLGTVLLAVTLSSSGDDGDGARAARPTGPGGSASAGADEDRGTARDDQKKPSASASASPSPSGSGRPGEGPTASESAGGGGGGAGQSGGKAAVNVAVRPYVYESPCSQHFLVDSEPEQVGPPATEQNAPRWAAALGAVSSGEQRVALTLQGTGEETVVLEALHVRVVTKGAPLAWNDYSMGVGCGGNVETESFDIDLDDGSPTVTVKNGQRDFPYKVSESDPEVFYVTARTKAHDVRWDLTLDWSSGDRRGTLHIDDNGAPFRTSGGSGRPGYDYPLGGSEWIERMPQE